MKKGILTGCIVLVLAALAWFGGRKLFGTKEADTETAEAEISDVSVSDAVSEETEAAADDAEADTTVSGDAAEGETESVSGNAAQQAETEEAVSEEEADAGDEARDTEEAAAAFSDEGVLYTIRTSEGNNLGMVPIVGGNAVVLMDSGAATYKGEYLPEEQGAYRTKLEEQANLAATEGKIGAWAFYRESSMKDFAFPEGVNVIEKFAFARSGLTNIVIPEGVTSIGYGAFYHCDSLSDVTIPDSVTSIEENAFAHTLWLENWMAEGTAGTSDEAAEAEMSEAGEAGAGMSGRNASETGDFLIVGDGILLAYRGSEENPEIPAGVKSIAAGAFR